jgi:hypothetical protein
MMVSTIHAAVVMVDEVIGLKAHRSLFAAPLAGHRSGDGLVVGKGHILVETAACIALKIVKYHQTTFS